MINYIILFLVYTVGILCARKYHTKIMVKYIGEEVLEYPKFVYHKNIYTFLSWIWVLTLFIADLYIRKYGIEDIDL